MIDEEKKVPQNRSQSEDAVHHVTNLKACTRNISNKYSFIFRLEQTDRWLNSHGFIAVPHQVTDEILLPQTVLSINGIHL